MPDAQDKMTIAGNWQELVWLCLQEILAEGILPAPYYDRHDRADHNCYCNLEHGLALRGLQCNNAGIAFLSRVA